MDTDFLLYDGECPACSAYVAIARLRQLYPALKILNARSEPDLVAELRTRGYEINDGMVLCLGGAIHFGADATRMIAQLGSASSSRWRRTALGLIGTAIGTIISLALVYALNVWPVHFEFGRQADITLAPSIASVDIFLIAAIVVFVAIVASLQPAWKASRMDPITALRHV